jgi:glyoxylase-like metal-dependent hydrolase (beta-lactamase superfamily II)
MMKVVAKAVVQLSTLLLTTSAAHISWGQSGEPLIQQGTTVQVAEHVYAIPDDFVSLVPNVGIVVGAEATLVIDTGLGPRNGETVLEEVKRVSNNNTLYVVTTHYHPEHTLGTAGLGNDAIFIVAKIQQQEMANGDGIKNLFASRSALTAELLQGVEYPQADILFEGEIVLDLGGLTARIFQSGPLHTQGDTLVFIEEEAVLFSGDVVMLGVFPSLDANNGSITRWLQFLDQLETLNPDVIVGAHGSIGDAAMLENWRRLFGALTEETRLLKQAGLSEADAAARLNTEFSAKYPAWKSDTRRMNAAVSTLYRELQ